MRENENATIALWAIGACGILLGLIVLAANGWRGDYGAKPLVTWPYAVAVFVLSVACIARGCWLLVRGPRR